MRKRLRKKLAKRRARYEFEVARRMVWVQLTEWMPAEKLAVLFPKKETPGPSR